MKSEYNLLYSVNLENATKHIYNINIKIKKAPKQLKVSLPVWIVGSYKIRDFAKHLDNISALQNGNNIEISQIDKTSWIINNNDDSDIEINYQIYAFDKSPRGAYLDNQRGFFNGTSLFLQIAGFENQTHYLNINNPENKPNHKLATGLKPIKTNSNGFGIYRADNYDILVDSPVEIGEFQSFDFEIYGAKHKFIISNAHSEFNSDKLISDTQKICKEIIDFWQEKTPPVDNYLFMLNTVSDGYGGLEHINSTALICSRKDLPQFKQTAENKENYETLLGLISHEYFHTWNVKRIKPHHLAKIDYLKENYTDMLWFFEGFTSYYDDLLLVRAGVLSEKDYISRISTTINNYKNTAGKSIQSAKESSFNTWTRLYQPDENTPNSTISYYTKGSLIGLITDLVLIENTEKYSLQDVMRHIYKTHSFEKGITENDIYSSIDLFDKSGKTSNLLKLLNNGKDNLDEYLNTVLENIAVITEKSPLKTEAKKARALGFSINEKPNAFFIKNVYANTKAYNAGLSHGDEIIGIITKNNETWRVKNIEDIYLYAGKQKDIQLIISRDAKIMNLELTLEEFDTQTQIELKLDDSANNKIKLKRDKWFYAKNGE